MIKYSKINIFFLLAAFLMLPGFAFAAMPTISNVSGTVATGQTLTINGTNFVQESKTDWHPFWTSGSGYGFEGSSPSSDGYSADSNVVYDSSVKLMGNKSIKFSAAGASSNCPTGNLVSSAVVNMSGQTDYWLRGYVRYNSANNLWASSHLKMFDLLYSPTPNTYIQWGSGSTMPAQMIVVVDSGVTTYGSIPSGPLQNNRWYLVEAHIQPTQVNVFLDNAQIISASKSSNAINFLNFGLVNLCGTTSSFNLSNWMDGVATSSSRVYPASNIEISGNGTTWKYQEPVYLSDTAVQFKLDLSGLSGTNYQVRVTNNQQQTSATYSLSGPGGGDTTPPAAPSGLTVR